LKKNRRQLYMYFGSQDLVDKKQTIDNHTHAKPDAVFDPQTLIMAHTAIIDGEIVALDRNGKPLFDALPYHQRHGAIVFYAFDLLYFEAKTYLNIRCLAVKQFFKRILSGAPSKGARTSSGRVCCRAISTIIFRSAK